MASAEDVNVACTFLRSDYPNLHLLKQFSSVLFAISFQKAGKVAAAIFLHSRKLILRSIVWIRYRSDGKVVRVVGCVQVPVIRSFEFKSCHN